MRSTFTSDKSVSHRPGATVDIPNAVSVIVSSTGAAGVQFVDAEGGNRRALPHVPFREGASIESERFARCDTSVNS